MLLQILVSGFVLGCVYGLIALGYSLIYKLSGMMNFVQGDVLTLGAYFAIMTIYYKWRAIMKANMNIKVDTDVRDAAKSIFGQMGLDMTTAVNMFLLAAIREKGIPFELTTVSKASDDEIIELLARKLRNAEAQEKAGQMRNFDDFAAEMKSKYGRV